MLNQLLKFTLLSSFLLWLKPRWRGLLALCVLVVLVHVLHGEYLGYVELSDDRSMLVWSYVFKWTVLALGVFSYIFLSLFGSKARTSYTGGPRKKPNAPRETTGSVDDGFDFLRHKKQLQSRAEIILSHKKREEKNR